MCNDVVVRDKTRRVLRQQGHFSSQQVPAARITYPHDSLYTVAPNKLHGASATARFNKVPPYSLLQLYQTLSDRFSEFRHPESLQ